MAGNDPISFGHVRQGHFRRCLQTRKRCRRRPGMDRKNRPLAFKIYAVGCLEFLLQLVGYRRKVRGFVRPPDFPFWRQAVFEAVETSGW